MIINLILILIVVCLFSQKIYCVETLSLIQKKAILIEIIQNDYPDIKNQAFDYLFNLNDIISDDLNRLNTSTQIKKYAVFVRYLCFITLHQYDDNKGYICEVVDLVNCHNRHIYNWINVFL